jgi:acid phosphatase (class A)
MSKKQTMKQLLLFVGLSLLALTVRAQQKRELTPARGHYKQLSVYSPKPKLGNEEIDKLTFPYEDAIAVRRLSLKPIFLTNLTVDDFKIPNPPANSSEQTRMELNYLVGLQAQRTELDIQTSLYMANVYYSLRTTPADSSYHIFRRNLFFIGRSIGTWFHPDSLPATANLMARVWQDASYFMWSLKYKYMRVRPYVLEKKLKNLEETNWAAYPSGHSANSYINAYIYRELAPEFEDIFVKDAYDMAHSREIIGVHFPSDSEASRVFARQFVNRLFENPQFKREFELVKQEWRAKALERFSTPK